MAEDKETHLRRRRDEGPLPAPSTPATGQAASTQTDAGRPRTPEPPPLDDADFPFTGASLRSPPRVFPPPGRAGRCTPALVALMRSLRTASAEVRFLRLGHLIRPRRNNGPPPREFSVIKKHLAHRRVAAPAAQGFDEEELAGDAMSDARLCPYDGKKLRSDNTKGIYSVCQVLGRTLENAPATPVDDVLDFAKNVARQARADGGRLGAETVPCRGRGAR